MKIARLLTMRDRTRWRAWLAVNHRSVKEVWLVFFKKHTGRAGVGYEDALDEALCFGWIDSLVQRIDDDRYARKFTPRTDTTNWSALNQARLARLIKEGRMTAVGRAKVGAVKARLPAPRLPKDLAPPPELLEALRAHPKAWASFQALAPSHRRHYVGWILIAKKDETRRRRIHQAVRLLARNEKLGLK